MAVGCAKVQNAQGLCNRSIDDRAHMVNRVQILVCEDHLSLHDQSKLRSREQKNSNVIRNYYVILQQITWRGSWRGIRLITVHSVEQLQFNSQDSIEALPICADLCWSSLILTLVPDTLLFRLVSDKWKWKFSGPVSLYVCLCVPYCLYNSTSYRIVSILCAYCLGLALSWVELS